MEQSHDMININCMSQTLLTKLFLEKLLSRAKNKRSAIIDVSSISSFMPIQRLSVYAATKVYNSFVTLVLAQELKGENIDFLCLKPAYVESLMSKKKADGYYVITSHQCVRGALKDLGYENETFGHWTHKIRGSFFSLFYWFMRISSHFNSGKNNTSKKKD